MILRDPVHGLIAFESDEQRIIEQLLDTPEVQRLRRIRQLGFTSLAYPGAEHTRFSHALGTAHVMKLLLARLTSLHHDLAPKHRLTPQLQRDALAAALLHDIGHGPMSHTFEDAFPYSTPHEEWTRRMVLDPDGNVHAVLSSYDDQMPQRVAQLIVGTHELPYLAGAVSGTYDVDRCDYLLRDAHATGVGYGSFDLDWFHRSLRFAPASQNDGAPLLAVDGIKGIPAIESFVLARLFMFQQVYFHKATRIAEWMGHAAISIAVNRLRDGIKLPNTPAALLAAASQRSPTLQQYHELDDAALTTTLHAWMDSKDPLLADVCRRLVARKLFKAIELMGETGTDPDARAKVLEIARHITQKEGLDPDVYVKLDDATDTPFDDENDSLVVVFRKGRPKRPAQVSFLLGHLNGKALNRVRLIVAPEVRDRIVQVLDLR